MKMDKTELCDDDKNVISAGNAKNTTDAGIYVKKIEEEKQEKKEVEKKILFHLKLLYISVVASVIFIFFLFVFLSFLCRTDFFSRNFF